MQDLPHMLRRFLGLRERTGVGLAAQRLRDKFHARMGQNARGSSQSP